MSALTIFISFALYTLLIFVVAWITGRNSDSDSFYIGNHKSPWYVVAYGMIGASLSGVTFISIPGDVGNSHFSYMLIVFGYLIGYFVIATVLLPLYYRLNLTSIYTYLEQRFGTASYKTGASYFLLSRIIGASFRMFLVVNVLQIFVFEAWNIPFAVTVILFVLLILLYTFKGGIRTIVWTDTLQTTFMLAAVGITIMLVQKEMGLSFSELTNKVFSSDYGEMIKWNWQGERFYLKQFISGVFIAIVMTGLDQDMMQKNLSCRNIKDAKKNMFWMAGALVPVNFLFLLLGATLFIFANERGIAIPEYTDDLFPTMAIKHLGAVTGVVFIIGLISAAYSSADSALTSLTTSFSLDILDLEKKEHLSKKQKTKYRYLVHISFAALLSVVIIVFKAVNDQSVISQLFKMAGYTYGPLLGMFTFGLFTKYNVKDKWVPVVAILAPIITYIINENSQAWFWGYKFGFELLLVNGILTFFGLLWIKNNLQLVKEK
ncbi:MAG: sodium:solute symporter [Bacteroidales bacterium]|nr:sodium:solute symporter [Bacteroidales bacterium]